MSADDNLICLAIPDGPGGFGESCATRDQVEQRGLHVALISPRGGAMVAVVPDTTSDATLSKSVGANQTVERLKIVDGTISAAAAAAENARVSYVIAGRRETVLLRSRIRCITVAGSQQTLERSRKLHGPELCSKPVPVPPASDIAPPSSAQPDAGLPPSGATPPTP